MIYVVPNYLFLTKSLGYFKQIFFSKIFLTNLPNLFAISAGQLYTKAAVKELSLELKLKPVGSSGVEAGLQLQLRF